MLYAGTKKLNEKDVRNDYCDKEIIFNDRFFFSLVNVFLGTVYFLCPQRMHCEKS